MWHCKRRSNQRLVFLFILAAIILISRWVLKKRDHEVKRSVNYIDKWITGSLAKPNTNRNLTVVTAFFDIGAFPKVTFQNMRDPDIYNRWAHVFSQLQNPLVVYTDNPSFETLMRQLRSNNSLPTVIIRVNRSDLWSFQILPEIKKIYETPGYPKHYPNTYIPEYTSVMHSKHALMAKAVKDNFFKTEYFNWLDVGHFRGIYGTDRKFWLEVPDDFDSNKIAMTRVYNANLHISPQTVILENRQWLCGSLFLGKADVMLKFGRQYKEAVMRYLKQGLSNVDQQILYAMYTKQEKDTHPLEVEIQGYIPGQKEVFIKNRWFYLGYLMYKPQSNPI